MDGYSHKSDQHRLARKLINVMAQEEITIADACSVLDVVKAELLRIDVVPVDVDMGGDRRVKERAKQQEVNLD